MEPIKIKGMKAPGTVKEFAKAGKTKGERLAEELTVKRISIELPASVHRAYAALELANKKRAAEIINIIKRLK